MAATHSIVQTHCGRNPLPPGRSAVFSGLVAKQDALRAAAEPIRDGWARIAGTSLGLQSRREALNASGLDGEVHRLPLVSLHTGIEVAREIRESRNDIRLCIGNVGSLSGIRLEVVQDRLGRESVMALE